MATTVSGPPTPETPTDDSVDEILSEVQADDYYAIVPEWLLFHPDLSHGAVRLYGVLRRFADQRGIAFPGLSAIGEKYGVVPRSVTRHMDELIAAGAVTKKRRIGRDHKATSNLYRVHSRPTFLHVTDDFNPSTTAATTAAAKTQRTKMSDGDRTKMSDGPSDKNVRLTTATLNHNQDDPQGSAALRAATADPLETSRSNVTSGNASAGAAAATGSSEDPGDAPRANPDQILAAMLVNLDEGARFRAWLVQATNASNPDGLIVSLHSAGRLSERLAQWRTAESTQNPAPTPGAASSTPRAHLEWCGRCDGTTRTTIELDGNGREYVRRCPTCNINAGNATPGTGAVQAIAQQAALAATNRSRSGREAFEAARAALPQGVSRRVTTIGEPVDPAAARRAESEQNA